MILGDHMKFDILDDGKKIEATLVMTFHDSGNNISYVVYTDGTKDDTGELELYASRYVEENGVFKISPIQNEYEWNLIDNMLEARGKEREDGE